MKTKEVKRAEAIARNARHRADHLKEAQEKGLMGAELSAFVDMKIGIPKPDNRAFRQRGAKGRAMVDQHVLNQMTKVYNSGPVHVDTSLLTGIS